LGTLHYSSPEKLSGDKDLEKEDIWALGIICFYLSENRLPFLN